MADGAAEPDFFPFEAKGYEIAAATEKLSAPAGKAKLRKSVKKLEGDWPTQLAGLLVEFVAAVGAVPPRPKLAGRREATAENDLNPVLGLDHLRPRIPELDPACIGAAA